MCMHLAGTSRVDHFFKSPRPLAPEAGPLSALVKAPVASRVPSGQLKVGPKTCVLTFYLDAALLPQWVRKPSINHMHELCAHLADVHSRNMKPQIACMNGQLTVPSMDSYMRCREPKAQ